MRNLIIAGCMAVTISACNNETDSYRITVDLEGTGDKWVKLMQRIDRQYVTFDSVLVARGTTAKMTGDLDGVQVMYLTAEDHPGSIQLLMENAAYEITGTPDDPVIETGSKAQKDLNAYRDTMEPFTVGMNELGTKMRQASESGDSEMLNQLREEYSVLYYEKQAMDSSFTVLIDCDGTISAKKLHGSELRSAIENLL